MSTLSPSQKPTILFLIYQNNTWTIRRLVDETIDPVTQHIILKIVGFQLYVPALPLSTTMLILVLYMAYTCISNLNEFKSFMNKTCTAFIVPSSSSCNQDIFLETSLISFCDENEHSTAQLSSLVLDPHF